MDLRIDGKVALVTGADRGIGRAIAVRLAEAGASLTITYYSNREGADETDGIIRRHGRRALVVQADVGQPDDVDRLFQLHDEQFGQINVLVNNAGVGFGGSIVEQSFERWERTIRTNLHGPFLCLQQAARRMIAQGSGGRIVNISSVHEEACNIEDVAYNVSKGGLRNLTRSAATELGPYGVTVNGIAPGMILTAMNQAALDDPAVLRSAEERIVLRRAGLPGDVANMAHFLVSDAASYCTGATYYVDGGWMLTWPPV
jgi:glucose 1-dehydrogenase